MIVASLLYLAFIGASPIGLVIFGAFLLGACLYWRAALRHIRPAIGLGPLVFGYVLAAEGWFLSSLLLTGSSFGGTSAGIVLLTFLFGLLPAFLVLTIVGVPVATFLVRTNRLGYRMGTAVLLLFLALATLLVAVTSRGGGIGGVPADSFVHLVGQVAIVVVPPGGAAIAGLVFAVRRTQRRGTALSREGSPPAAIDASERHRWADTKVQLAIGGVAFAVVVAGTWIFEPAGAPTGGLRGPSAPAQSVTVQSAPRPQGLLAFWIAPEQAADVRTFIANLARAEGFEVRDSSRADAEAGVPLISLEIARGDATVLVIAGGRGLGTQPIEVDRLTLEREFDAFTILLVDGLRERWPPNPPAAP